MPSVNGGKSARTQRIKHMRPNGTVHTAFAFPLRIIQLQVGLVYLFTFLLKLPGDSWTGGKAVYQAMQLDAFLIPTGRFFVAYAPEFVFQGMTYYALLAEGLFIVLVFFPFVQPRLRLIGLTLTGLLHIGIASLMAVPDFSILMLITYVLFFEPEWILKLAPKPPPQQLPYPFHIRAARCGCWYW